MALLSKDEVITVFQKITSFSSAGEVQVSLEGGVDSTLRFARNEIIDYALSDHLLIRINFIKDRKSAEVTGNSIDENSLRNLINQAELLAMQSGSTSVRTIYSDKQIKESSTWSANTASLNHERRIELVAEATSLCLQRKMIASGSLVDRQWFNAVLNSKGVVFYQKSSPCSFSLNVRTGQSSGSAYSAVADYDINALKPGKIAEELIAKAQSTTNSRTPETGKLAVVLEPRATSDLMGTLLENFRKFPEAQQADFREVSGEKALHEGITLISDPSDKVLPFVPFTQNGTKLVKTTWIERGKILRLPNQSIPFTMSGGTQSTEDLIKTVANGILISRLNDLQVVDSEGRVCTGNTRDGIWLIENGKVKHPVKNMRFQVNVIDFFRNLSAIGKPEKVEQQIIAPVAGNGFYFTAVTDSY